MRERERQRERERERETEIETEIEREIEIEIGKLNRRCELKRKMKTHTKESKYKI